MWVSENAVYPPLMVNKKNEKIDPQGKSLKSPGRGPQASPLPSMTQKWLVWSLQNWRLMKLIPHVSPLSMVLIVWFNSLNHGFSGGVDFYACGKGYSYQTQPFYGFFSNLWLNSQFPMVSFSQGGLIFWCSCKGYQVTRWPLRWPQQQQPLVLWEVRLLHIKQLALETWRITQVIGGVPILLLGWLPLNVGSFGSSSGVNFFKTMQRLEIIPEEKKYPMFVSLLSNKQAFLDPWAVIISYPSLT